MFSNSFLVILRGGSLVVYMRSNKLTTLAWEVTSGAINTLRPEGQLHPLARPAPLSSSLNGIFGSSVFLTFVATVASLPTPIAVVPSSPLPATNRCTLAGGDLFTAYIIPGAASFSPASAGGISAAYNFDKPIHEVLAIGQPGDRIVVYLLMQGFQPRGFLNGPVMQTSYHVIRGLGNAAQFRYARLGNGEKAPFGNSFSLFDHRGQWLLDTLQYQHADEPAEEASCQKPE